MSPEEEMLSFSMEEGLFVVQADSRKIVTLNGQDITAEIETELPTPEKKSNNSAP